MQTINENVTSILKEDGKLTESDQETAEILANYFEEVFMKEDTENIPKVVEQYLNWQDAEIKFNVATVLSKLKELKVDKSPRPDGIHPIVLKECPEAIAEQLSLTFQKSFETSALPEEWKTAHVVPIYKKCQK
jgi:hypothetical protein